LYCKKCNTLNGCITYIREMRVRNIAVSQVNYEILQNFGKMGMSFNDVISELIKKVQITKDPRLNDKKTDSDT
jgi:predicted CopG family antitoxin